MSPRPGRAGRSACGRGSRATTGCRSRHLGRGAGEEKKWKPYSASLQRLHVFDQLEELLLGHESLKRRHDGLKTRRDLRSGVENRFANVRLVDDDRPAAFERLCLAEQPLEDRAPALRVGTMAGVARQVLEEFFTGRGE